MAGGYCVVKGHVGDIEPQFVQSCQSKDAAGIHCQQELSQRKSNVANLYRSVCFANAAMFHLK